MQDRVEVPDAPRLIVVGLNEHDSPAAGDTKDESVIVPVNPFTDEMEIVDFPGALARTVTLDGLAEMVKSGTPPTVNTTV